MLLKPTFKLHLQHLVLIVNDVPIRFEGVARTVHTDFQSQISSWWQTMEERISKKRSQQYASLNLNACKRNASLKQGMVTKISDSF